MQTDPRPLLLYVLHSGQMFGTERMALATLQALPGNRQQLLLAPPGPAVAEALRLGIPAEVFSGTAALARRMAALFLRHRSVTLIATGVSQSLIAILCASLTRSQLRHLHIVHGGTDERLSYGRKRLLAPFAVDFVAVSQFVRQRLIAHRVPAARIQVIENFLPEGGEWPRREMPQQDIQRLAVVSRLDPIKRIDVLLGALESDPALSGLTVDIFGTGGEGPGLQARAAAANLAVNFRGFSTDVPGALAMADALVHTCPEEPFGLAVLEAMRAGIPVLVPDTGGPATFIQHGVNGLRYRSGDSRDLARQLHALRAMRPERRRDLTETAQDTLRTRFARQARIADYQTLLASPFSGVSA